MKPGDKVKVYKAWCSRGHNNTPLYHWDGGYELVSINKRMAVVKHLTGLFAGMKVNYPAHNVKLEEF